MVGASLYVGENHDENVEVPYIQLHFYEGPDNDTVAAALAAAPNPVDLRTVRVTLTMNDFLSLFKRFSLTLSVRTLNLEGREYNTTA